VNLWNGITTSDGRHTMNSFLESLQFLSWSWSTLLWWNPKIPQLGALRTVQSIFILYSPRSILPSVPRSPKSVFL
jgi:hypothetical protein